MRKLRLRPKAKNDLDGIWEHTLENWGQTPATKYLKKINRTFDLIACNPYIGRPRGKTLAGLHVVTAEKHILCYLVDNYQIDVSRILHRCMEIESSIL